MDPSPGPVGGRKPSQQNGPVSHPFGALSLTSSSQPHPSIARLDNAVADILSRLKMPPLESYTRQQRVSESVSQTTRENSREPLPEGEHEMAPAPMGSLYEVTQLNSLRSRLKHGDPARRNSKTLMEADLISQGVITLEEAEEMLTL